LTNDSFVGLGYLAQGTDHKVERVCRVEDV